MPKEAHAENIFPQEINTNKKKYTSTPAHAHTHKHSYKREHSQVNKTYIYVHELNLFTSWKKSGEAYYVREIIIVEKFCTL